MPGSDPSSIEPVIRVAWILAPKSVLDVGAGSGKFGALFRDYLEARNSDQSGNYSHKRAVRIDAVEGFPKYIGDLHRLVYDNVYPVLIQDFLKHTNGTTYDLIYAGDIIEHLDKSEAETKFIPALLAMSNMGLLISVPAVTNPQEAVYGNELEIHRSQWTAADFRKLAPHSHIGRKGEHLLAFLSKQPQYAAKFHVGLKRRVRNFLNSMKDSW